MSVEKLYCLRKPVVSAFRWTGDMRDTPEWFQKFVDEGKSAWLEKGVLWIDETGQGRNKTGGHVAVSVEVGDYVYYDCTFCQTVTSLPHDHFMEQYSPLTSEMEDDQE